MVQNTFYIQGQKVFEVGLRFSLVSLGSQNNVKVFATNQIKDNRVKVVASGTKYDITSFHNYVTNNDARHMKQDKSPYIVTPLVEYRGSKIDYESYKQSLMNEQIGKMLYSAGNRLPTIENQLGSIDDKLDSIDTSMKEMNSGFKRLSKIDKRST